MYIWPMYGVAGAIAIGTVEESRALSLAIVGDGGDQDQRDLEQRLRGNCVT